MRVLGRELSLFAQTSDPPKGTVGIDGDSPFSHLVAGGFDLTPELSGTRKYRTLEEMRKSDAMIRSILYMYKLPLRSAVWSLAAAEDDPDARIRDAVARQFGLEDWDGEMDLSWDEWLAQTLLFLDFGAMGEEICWSLDLELWELGPGPDGKPRPPVLIRKIARMAPRFPVTVDEIKYDARTGEIVSVRQGFLGNNRPIPGEKIIWYVHEQEGSNWFGTSLLRAMYGPWRLKKALMIAAAIGWDRFSSGVPVVRYPKGGGARQKMEAERTARNYRTHERAWVAFEGTATEGWDIDIKGGNSTLADPTPLIGLYNEEMATAALQIFSRLGTSHHGSRAVGQVLADPYYLAIQSYAKWIAQKRMRKAFRTFVDVNFGEQFQTPKLTVSKIQAQNILVLAQAIQYLAAAGLNFTDRDTQNNLRGQMDLNDLPEPVSALIKSLPDNVGIQDANELTDPFDVPAPGTVQPAAAGFVAAEGDDLPL